MKTSVKNDLIFEIGECFTDSNCPLWLPGITPKLVRFAWDSLQRNTSLTPDTYGTARVLANDPKAPRNVFSRLSIPQLSDGQSSHLVVELLDGSAACRYENLGLIFVPGDDIANTTTLDCIGDAMSVLAHVQSLRDTIIQLVKVVHIVQSNGPDYDVSHSDPQVPFSIFLSIPNQRSAFNSLRVAEAIVHEAMHLQLTIVEQLVTLAHETSQNVFSPWKAENRSIGGTIHGLYVFLIINNFYDELLALSLYSARPSYYMQKRIERINEEIQALNLSNTQSSLSKHGKILLSRLLGSA